MFAACVNSEVLAPEQLVPSALHVGLHQWHQEGCWVVWGPKRGCDSHLAHTRTSFPALILSWLCPELSWLAVPGTTVALVAPVQPNISQVPSHMRAVASPGRQEIPELPEQPGGSKRGGYCAAFVSTHVSHLSAVGGFD